MTSYGTKIKAALLCGAMTLGGTSVAHADMEYQQVSALLLVVLVVVTALDSMSNALRHWMVQ